VGRGQDVASGFEVTSMVEKPARGTAPSNLYLNGRYILQPEIFDILSLQERGTGNEIQLTDAMLKLQVEQAFHGVHFQGRTFDCGSPEGFVEANVAFALWRKDLSPRMSGMIAGLLEEYAPGMRKTGS
jgi:UTP--glucose-1-phosphate uridylyltransferase